MLRGPNVQWERRFSLSILIIVNNGGGWPLVWATDGSVFDARLQLNEVPGRSSRIVPKHDI